MMKHSVYAVLLFFVASIAVSASYITGDAIRNPARSQIWTLPATGGTLVKSTDNIATATLAASATALAANGANCSSGQYPKGVDASGAVESCTAVSLTADVSGILPVANGGTGQATQYLGPAGLVIMTAATSCPTGSIAADGSSLLRSGGTSCGGGACANLFSAISTTYGSADGTHFNVPDMRGVFARGAGTQSISGISHTGTQGTTENDNFQGHRHNRIPSGNVTWQLDTGTVGSFTFTAGGFDLGSGSSTGNASVSDGTNGTPRTGGETRPANISLLYCIVY